MVLFGRSRSQGLYRYLSRLARKRPFAGVPDKTDFVGTVQVSWRKVGRVRLDRKSKLDFDYYVDLPGVYRISITEVDGARHEYIGESGNLKRRFSDYRHPKTPHDSRMTNALTAFLVQGAEIEVELVNDALMDLNGLDQELDFNNGNHRKFIEYFALTATWTEGVKRLNR